jgi:hypothetical protein
MLREYAIPQPDQIFLDIELHTMADAIRVEGEAEVDRLVLAHRFVARWDRVRVHRLAAVAFEAGHQCLR